MFNRVASKSKPKETVISRPAKSPPAGRERLTHFDDQIGLAKQAIAELAAKIERFEGIIADADVNHRALQSAIEADNGKSLAAYSAGDVPADSSIARLVLLGENSKRAASAATAALPGANSQLENANRQLLDLGEQRNAELNRVLTMLGDFDAQEYSKAFDRLCLYHDKLVGFANVGQSSLGEIQLIVDPLRTPRFAFPSMRGHIDSDPFLRHKVSDVTVAESARKWLEIRERLSVANADVNDLLTG